MMANAIRFFSAAPAASNSSSVASSSSSSQSSRSSSSGGHRHGGHSDHRSSSSSHQRQQQEPAVQSWKSHHGKSSNNGPTERYFGVVDRVFDDRKFGFISWQGSNVFFHFKYGTFFDFSCSCSSASFPISNRSLIRISDPTIRSQVLHRERELETGDEVEFQLQENPRSGRLCCARVRLVNAAPRLVDERPMHPDRYRPVCSLFIHFPHLVVLYWFLTLNPVIRRVNLVIIALLLHPRCRHLLSRRRRRRHLIVLRKIQLQPQSQLRWLWWFGTAAPWRL